MSAAASPVPADNQQPTESYAPATPGAVNFARVLQAEEQEIDAQCGARGVVADLNFDGDGWPPDNPGGRKFKDRFGVAFSGGGIRSACVSIGILQALAEERILNQVHYLSGISGGGYTVGWLTAWINRQPVPAGSELPNGGAKLAVVEERLANNSDTGNTEPAAQPPYLRRHLEPNPLHFLRRYSSYLTPRQGLLSGDSLAMFSVYLRNVLLNQCMLACAAIAIFLLLQGAAFSNTHRSLQGVFLGGRLMFCALVCVTFLLSSGLAIYFASSSLSRLESDEQEKWWWSRAALAGGIIACIELWLLTPRWMGTPMPAALPASLHRFQGWWYTICFVLLPSFCGWLTTLIRNNRDRGTVASVDRSRLKFWPTTLAWASAAVLGYCVEVLTRHWILQAVPVGGAGGLRFLIHVPRSYALFGLPFLLVAVSLESYLWIGMMGRSMADARREWLARATGYLIAAAAGLVLLFGIAIYGPLAVHLVINLIHSPEWKKKIIGFVLPGGWLFTVVSGVLGGKSAKTGDAATAESKSLDWLVRVAPPVFLLGILVLGSWASHTIVRHTIKPPRDLTATDTALPYCANDYLPCAECAAQPGKSCLRWAEPVTWDPHRAQPARGYTPHQATDHPERSYIFLFFLFAGVAVGLSLRLDTNEFSLHLFYRNRLVRAFLGASRPERSQPDGQDPRRPSPFTGFAAYEDIFLHELTLAKGFPGPYPVWGTCLNLTAGEDLAWQQRKGASFIYSPLFCGWDYINSFALPAEPEPPADDPDEGREERQKDSLSKYGYRSTQPIPVADPANENEADAQVPGYGGTGGAPQIGTAMAASGAAVSPNMGYHSSPGIAALLTIFDVRLGFWTGNPRHPKRWQQYAPGIWYLLRELLGQTNDRAGYVYLSDGGHFENLGIYELVRRRVRLIVCSDADADPDFAFGDLGNAIDHCRRDFGVEIKIQAQSCIAAAKLQGFRDAHFAIGEIIYPGQKERGLLLYLKSSLTSDEPGDVLGMKAKDKDFPHDTTLNQFFDEMHFEAYRALGQHIMQYVLRDKCKLPTGPLGADETAADRVCQLFRSLRSQLPKAPGTESAEPAAFTVPAGQSFTISLAPKPATH